MALKKVLKVKVVKLNNFIGLNSILSMRKNLKNNNHVNQNVT